jgi:phenylacetate-CoA ligase
MSYNLLLERVILPAGDLVNRSAFIKELNKWRKLQYLSEEELKALQKENLLRMLRHCIKNVKFYKKLNLNDVNDPYQWVKSFPIIKKHIIKENLPDFLTEPRENLIEYASSGSSGIQGIVYMNKKEQSTTRALQVLWWEWAGFKIGEPILQTGITDKRSLLKATKDKLFRTNYTPAFKHSEESIRDLLLKFNHSDNHFLGGYASSLFLFAQVAQKYGINDITFKSVICWGDKLFPHYRKAIEKQFHTTAYDTYGCTEGLMMAAQKDLPYYYQMAPHVYMEIIDKDGNEVPDGELGYVVVTRLDCFSMPLVRYYLGDMAIKLPREDYPEKRDLNFPLLKQIIGRDTDIVRTASGKFMVVHFFTGIFEFIPEVKQFRVIQRTLDEIEIEYIPEKNFDDKKLEEIRLKIQEHLKEKFPISFRKVDFIPATKSGKPQIIESHLKKLL